MNKTHKSASQRLKVTATGKVLHHRMGHGHLMTSKNAKRRRRLRKPRTDVGRCAKKLAGYII